MDRPSQSTARASFIDLCRGPHRADHRSCRRIQVALNTAEPIGAATNAIPCCSGSTAPPFPPRQSWTPISPDWKKSNDETTGKLGKELDLISIQDEIGPGLVLWHPKGATDPAVDRKLLARTAYSTWV